MQLKTKILISVFSLFFVFPIFAHAGDFAVQFASGTPDAIIVPADAELNITDDFRIEQRFTITSCTGLFTGMFAQNAGDAFSNYTYISLFDNGNDCNGLEIFVQDTGAGSAFHTCEATINDGEEHTVIWERNGQTFTCEIDGQDAFVFGSQSGGLGVSATNTETQIGNFDNDTAFGGRIHYTRIDIDDTCAGLWEFTEGSGTTLADTCGGTANNGTFSGTPTWFNFLSQATGIRFTSRNTQSGTPAQLSANVTDSVGSVFPIVLLSIGVFLTFYIIQKVMFMFPAVEKATIKRGRRRKGE